MILQTIKEVEFNRIYQGDVLEVLKTWPDEFVDCIIIPYYGIIRICKIKKDNL